MSLMNDQCNKVCRIIDDVLANRPTERDSLIVAVRKAFESLEQFGNSEQLPSAQPRKKGKWEWCGNHRLCSECDEWALTVWNDNEYEEVDVLTNFCPNCGADMRGEQDED